MRSDDAKSRLIAMLRDAGVDLDQPTAQDVGRTWSVMPAFFEEDVEDAAPRDEDGDMLLAQYGVFGFTGQPMFELDMTRQFSFYDDDGEYDHMAQLNCTFRFVPTDDLRAVGQEILWSGGPNFLERALALPGFRLVEESRLTPRELSIDFGDV